MDGNFFVDIFATKGIEYILVLVFLVAFVLFMRALLTDRSDRDHPTSGGKRGSAA